MHEIGDQVNHIPDLGVEKSLLQELAITRCLLFFESYAQLLRKVKYRVHSGGQTTFEYFIIDPLTFSALLNFLASSVSLLAQIGRLQIVYLCADPLQERWKIPPQVVVLLLSRLACIHIVHSCIMEGRAKSSISSAIIHAYRFVLDVLFQSVEH